MKKLNILYVLFFVFYSCNSQPGSYKVTGLFENANGLTLYMTEMTPTEFIPIDSVVLNEKGTFSMTGNTSGPKFLFLFTDPNKPITLLINTNEKINITGDAQDLIATYDVEGSEDSKLIRELNVYLNNTVTQINFLGNNYRQELDSIKEIYEGKPDIYNSEFEKLQAVTGKNYDSLLSEQRNFTIIFIEKNLSSLASLMALYQKYDSRTFVLNGEEDFKYFQRVDSVLFKLYPESNFVKVLHGNVAEIQKQLDVKKWMSMGSEIPVPEISLPNPDGDTITLSSYRGQYVLLDFWAAWCGPCRAENPNLVANYEKYHSKGFEIFQVSLDKSYDDWIKAIKDDLLDWVHVSDLKFWNSVVVPLFNIESIPANFLLDKEGNIIAKNLRGSRLGDKLAEIFD